MRCSAPFDMAIIEARESSMVSNRERTAVVGKSLPLAAKNSIHYAVAAERNGAISSRLWESLTGIDTLFLASDRTELVPWERQLISEAQDRGIKLGFLKLQSLQFLFGIPEEIQRSFEQFENLLTGNRQPTRIGLLFGERDSHQPLLKAGADQVIRIPGDTVSWLQRDSRSLHSSIYEVSKHFPPGGTLFLQDQLTIPFWMLSTLLQEAKGSNTALHFVSEDRTVNPEGFSGYLRERQHQLTAESPRRLIVLGAPDSESRNLKSAIHAASSYRDAEEAQISYVEADDEEAAWKWDTAFKEAQLHPNSFIVLEHGSMLARGLVDLIEELRVIHSLGGGLAIGNHSTWLFQSLGASYFVLADEPLLELIEHLELSKEFQSMGMLTATSKLEKEREAHSTVQALFDQDYTAVEISKRLGLDRSTIRRWTESRKSR